MHLQNKIIAALTPTKRKSVKEEQQSNYLLAKKVFRFRVLLFNSLKDLALLTIGFIAAGFGLKGFLLPNKFVDGGATGISLLINQTIQVPLAIVLMLVNIPFIMLGYHQIGRSFVIKTIYAIVGLSLVVAFIDYPVITSDKLLISVFGGFFLGAGIGLAVRGGGVLDGTEVLAIYVSRRTSLTIGDVIMVVNIVIFSFVAYFLGLEVALYSILTYMAASKTVDFIVEGLEEYTGVTIISPKSHEISEIISKKMGRGITVYKGIRGYGKTGHSTSDMDIVFTVITRLEISRLQMEISAIDPHAFVVMHSIKDTKGGMIKKRPLK
jgi:uncharacterized membrane-anchored protein YitT (DUF2179 family)